MGDSVHVVCPGCSGVNRVPSSRLPGNPLCGKCRAPLFQRHPVELTAATFDTHVGRSDLPVIVDFWAPWCGPCKMMGPVIAEAARVLAPGVRVAKLNTDAETAIAARFAIRSIPTLAVFQRGRLLQQRAGATTIGALVDWVRSVVQTVGKEQG